MNGWSDDYRFPVTVESLEASLKKLSDPELLPPWMRGDRYEQEEYERVVSELDLTELIRDYVWDEAHAEYEARGG
jgi:hypothetical protein